MNRLPRRRVPIPLVLITTVALVVAGWLFVEVVTSLLLRLVQLTLVVIAFVAMWVIGLYLWRRGDMSPPK